MTLEQALEGAALCAKESQQDILVFFDVETAGYEYGALKAVAQVWPKFRPRDAVMVFPRTGREPFEVTQLSD